MKISHTFGTFIKEKRLQKDISLRKFADQIGISAVYLSNLENDRMSAPKDDVVSTMARLLLLNEADTAMLYDLAAKAKSNVTVSQSKPEKSLHPPKAVRTRTIELGHDKQLLGCIVMPFLYCILSA